MRNFRLSSFVFRHLKKYSCNLNHMIYNVLGQKATGYQSSVNASELFTYHFDASQLATGLYIVQLELGKVKLNSKLYLIK